MVVLAVKHAYVFVLYFRFPSERSIPLYSSVTLLEETAPAKLTTSQCLPKGIRLEIAKERCFIGGQSPPSYAKQLAIPYQCEASVKLPGSSCPGAGRPHLHSHFNFVGQ